MSVKLLVTICGPTGVGNANCAIELVLPLSESTLQPKRGEHTVARARRRSDAGQGRAFHPEMPLDERTAVRRGRASVRRTRR